MVSQSLHWNAMNQTSASEKQDIATFADVGYMQRRLLKYTGVFLYKERGCRINNK